jgi:hypothetical protein
MAESRSIAEALDGIASQVKRISDLPKLTIGPHEEVYLLSAEGTRELHGQSPPKKTSLWFYHLTGAFTELTGATHGGGQLESVLSWFPAEVGPIVLQFPDASLGDPPFDKPPANGYKGVATNAEVLGHTKTRLVFPDGSTIVSIGVNQTKLTPCADGGVELFETNTEVIARGTGRFEGAKGLVTSDMGAYFSTFVPLDPLQEPYKSGFPVKVFVCIRLVTKASL